MGEITIDEGRLDELIATKVNAGIQQFSMSLQWQMNRVPVNNNAAPLQRVKVIGSAVEGFPFGSNYTFGLTRISATKLKVWKGKFRRWNDQVYHAPDTEVTFSGDGDQFIVWKWSESGGLVIQATPQDDWPDESDSTYIYGVVHQVNLTAGVFTLVDAVQDGIINAPIDTKGDI